MRLAETIRTPVINFQIRLAEMYPVYFDEVCERFCLGLMDELWAAWLPGRSDNELVTDTVYTLL